jgi:short-subunit dehydrogenase
MTFETLLRKPIVSPETGFSGEWRKKMSNSNIKGTALITGASTGMGAIYADRLSKRGYDLILVARNETRLNAVAERLRKDTGRKVTVLPADLNNKADLAKVEAVLRSDTSVSLLVNNAGFGGVAPLLKADVDQMEDMIKLNVTALTRLTYAAVPGFVERGRGTVINISSVVGIANEMLNGVYGASKAYVLAFGHSLQHELADKGLRIQTVLPGATATEFWDIAGFPHANMPKEIVMSPDDVVDAALAGLDQGETVTIPGLQDGADWTSFEAARREISKKFGQSKPAPRYGVTPRTA